MDLKHHADKDELYWVYVNACREHMYDEVLRLTDEGKLSSSGAKKLITALLPKIYDGDYPWILNNKPFRR